MEGDDTYCRPESVRWSRINRYESLLERQGFDVDRSQALGTQAVIIDFWVRELHPLVEQRAVSSSLRLDNDGSFNMLTLRFPTLDRTRTTLKTEELIEEMAGAVGSRDTRQVAHDVITSTTERGALGEPANIKFEPRAAESAGLNLHVIVEKGMTPPEHQPDTQRVIRMAGDLADAYYAALETRGSL